MAVPPLPVAFEPEHHARPWGGRRINDLLGTSASAPSSIGESVLLLDAPHRELTVRDGPARGRTIRDLVTDWQTGLLGALRLDGTHLPIGVSLVNVESLSDVTVVPSGSAALGAAARDLESTSDAATASTAGARTILYLMHADPAAEIRLGLKPGVSPDSAADAIGAAEFAWLLRRGPLRSGQCYQIPPGVPWALGGGVLAVRIDAGPPAPHVRLDGPPRDATQASPPVEATSAGGGHRGPPHSSPPPHSSSPPQLDRGRPRPSSSPPQLDRGRPRPPREDQWSSLLRPDLPLDEIMQQRRHVASVFSTSTRLVSREEALVEKVRLVQGLREEIAYGELTVLVVLSGRGAIESKHGNCAYRPGDALLIPAGAAEPHVRTETDSEWLEIKLPVASSLGGFDRPPPEPPPVRSEHVPLTWAGRRLDERRGQE